MHSADQPPRAASVVHDRLGDQVTIKWNATRGKWVVYDMTGGPLAQSSRLESLTRHFPDAEVEERGE